MTDVKKVPLDLINLRLDKASAEMFNDFSRSKLKKWIIEGRILLNGEIASPKEIVHLDDEIEINPVSEKIVTWESEDISFDVIFENDDFLIINKRANLVMHPGAGCNNGTLANGLLYRYPELENIPRCGIVHRLDKDTSGVLLVARNEKFRNYFVSLLQDREVKKSYKAFVVGNVIGSFTINEPIGRDKNNRVKMAIRADGKEAETFIKNIKTFNNYSLLDISISSGRTHQIRVHLSSHKLPIVGDKTYNPSANIAKDTPLELANVVRSFPRQALHSYELSFYYPKLDQHLTYHSEMHDDMKELQDTFEKYL